MDFPRTFAFRPRGATAWQPLVSTAGALTGTRVLADRDLHGNLRTEGAFTRGAVRLQDVFKAELFPFKVSGDCLYGANRTKDGWWLWVFNNRGVTKFADKMAKIDHACDAEVEIASANARISSAKELLSGGAVQVADGAFKHRVAAGDLAVFGIK